MDLYKSPEPKAEMGGALQGVQKRRGEPLQGLEFPQGSMQGGDFVGVPGAGSSTSAGPGGGGWVWVMVAWGPTLEKMH